MEIKSKEINPENTTPNNNSNTNVGNVGVIGKGKVTPFQVAFIVDRYLADNNFSQTRSSFRFEAASLISKSSPTDAPKSLRSLGELLDEYIWLKEQFVIIEQQKCGLALERSRIQTLLQGMQDVMNTYNSSVNCITPPPPPPPPPSVNSTVSAPSTSLAVPSPSIGYPASKTPVMTSVSTTQSVTMGRANFISPISVGRPPRKRRNHYYKDLEDAPQPPKKVYSGPLANYPFSDKVRQPINACSSKQSAPGQLSSPNFVQGGLLNQGSSVAKNLFDKLSQPSTSNSSIPKTPPRAVSSPSDKSISPLEEASSTAISHNTTAPPKTTPANCTIISSKTIIVSPSKHYSIERNECKFSSPVKTNIKRQSTREHVKGRLDFGSSDVPSSLKNVSGDGRTSSESEKEGDIFDMDLSNAFGPDFSLNELLTDFGINCGNRDYSCPATACTSTDANLESAQRNNEKSGTSQDLIKHSSKVAEVVPVDKTVKKSGTSQDMIRHSSKVAEVVPVDKTVNGSDSITKVKSVRKCIRIVGPKRS